MKVILNDAFINRVLNGEVSIQEQEAFRQILSSDINENEEVHLFLEKYWERAGELKDLPEPDSLAQLQVIHSKLGITQPSKIEQIAIQPRRSKQWLKIAAVLVPLAILGSLALFLLQKNKVPQMSFEAPSGTRIHKIMPDGSEIWLNANSRLSFNASYGKTTREVKLTGEAYFTVKPDKDRPFVVKASEVKIKVLGTSFNVSAYPSDSYIETTLENGKIEYSVGTNNKIYLKPGDQATLTLADRKLHIRKVQTNQYGLWRNNQLQFRNAELSFVLQSLEHWYGVHFTVTDQDLLKLHFTATIQHESLKQVLDLLAESIDIHYTQKGNSVSLNKSDK